MKYYHIVICTVNEITCILGIYADLGPAEERAKSAVGVDNVRIERWAESCAIFSR